MVLTLWLSSFSASSFWMRLVAMISLIPEHLNDTDNTEAQQVFEQTERQLI
ncbi:hypothetical protein [Vibrio panuliri]|uniref:hypothetical protein n=1 Tax=Vibrio panuliri TaxID=1381081 RepID=UPI00384FDDCB